MNTTSSSTTDIQEYDDRDLQEEYFIKFQLEPFITFPDCDDYRRDPDDEDDYDRMYMNITITQIKDFVKYITNSDVSEQKYQYYDEYITGIPLKRFFRKIYNTNLCKLSDCKMVKDLFRLWCSKIFKFDVKNDMLIIINGIALNYFVKISNAPFFVKQIYSYLVRILLIRDELYLDNNLQEIDFEDGKNFRFTIKGTFDQFIDQIKIVFDKWVLSFENEKNIELSLIYKKFWIDACAAFSNLFGKTQLIFLQKHLTEESKNLMNNFSDFNLPYVQFHDDLTPADSYMSLMFNSVLQENEKLNEKNEYIVKDLAQLRAENALSENACKKQKTQHEKNN